MTRVDDGQRTRDTERAWPTSELAPDRAMHPEMSDLTAAQDHGVVIEGSAGASITVFRSSSMLSIYISVVGLGLRTGPGYLSRSK